MNKLEAIEYLVQNEICSDEWAEAGMYTAISTIIKSEESFFTQEYLDVLLKEASEF